MSATLDRPARVLLFVAVFGQLGTLAHAVPWALFTDAESGGFCDVVNAANTELVIDAETGEFILVRGPDTVLSLTFVDDDLSVFFGNAPAGFVDFAEDAEGNRTLWWFTEAGDVANVNEFTGEPTVTGMFPEDFAGISCDACAFWDDPIDCVDEDGDGVDPRFDLCPDTFEDEVVDDDGCACAQLDHDNDGINNCFDLCPGSFEDEVVDDDGCACAQLDDDEDEINNCFDLCPNTREGASVDEDGCSRRGFASGGGLCGSFGAFSLTLMFCGLIGLRQRRARIRP